MLDGGSAPPDLNPLGGEEYFLFVAEGRSADVVACAAGAASAVSSVVAVTTVVPLECFCRELIRRTPFGAESTLGFCAYARTAL